MTANPTPIPPFLPDNWREPDPKRPLSAAAMRDVGFIHSVNRIKRYGWIALEGHRRLPNGKDLIFFHFDQINDDGRSLYEGDVVMFQIAPGIKGGYQAVQVQRKRC